MKKKAYVCITLFFALFLLALTAEWSRNRSVLYPVQSRFITEMELQGPVDIWHEREPYYKEAFESREYVKIR